MNENQDDDDGSSNGSMDVSGGSTTEDEEEFLQLMNSSSGIIQQSIHLLLAELVDDEESLTAREWGTGSQIGKSKNKDRDFEGAYQRLIKNYFSGTASTYDEDDFERRFRMPRSVFNRIYETIKDKGCFVEGTSINFSKKKRHPSTRSFDGMSSEIGIR
jgi:hypothetical protein